MRRVGTRLLLAMLGLSACASEREPVPDASAAAEVWVAKVGDEQVLARELGAELAKVKHEYRRVPAHEAPNWTTVKESLVHGLVEQRILLQEARRRGLTVPEKDVQRTVELSG